MKCPACNNVVEGLKSPFTGNIYCPICGHAIYENKEERRVYVINRA